MTTTTKAAADSAEKTKTKKSGPLSGTALSLTFGDADDDGNVDVTVGLRVAGVPMPSFNVELPTSRVWTLGGALFDMFRR